MVGVIGPAAGSPFAVKISDGSAIFLAGDGNTFNRDCGRHAKGVGVGWIKGV